MQRKILTIAAVLVVGVVFSLAAANRSNDIYVGVDNDELEQVAKEAEVGKTGKELYRTQNSGFRTVKRTTDADLENSFIWICIGNQCIPVDPFMPSN